MSMARDEERQNSVFDLTTFDGLSGQHEVELIEEPGKNASFPSPPQPRQKKFR